MPTESWQGSVSEAYESQNVKQQNRSQLMAEADSDDLDTDSIYADEIEAEVERIDVRLIRSGIRHRRSTTHHP